VTLVHSESVDERTYSLHDILEGIKTHIARCVVHLSVHGHGKTLANGGEHERPFASNERHLH
jgi:hypothetical protein